MPAAKSMPLKSGGLRDFSGGPNLRDTPPELAKNEVVDAWNVTFDERGGAASRLGYAKQNPAPFSGGPVVAQFWSGLLSKRITQAGPSLYLDETDIARKTFTTSAPCDFAETNSLLVAAHPVDGLHTSPDGITWTKVADPDAPANPLCVEVWQNKLFVGLADGTLRWSAIADPTSWDPAGFNRIWEKDQAPIVALAAASGEDIQGRPGLLAFKQESFVRVYDAATGAYTTISSTVGAAGKKAVVAVGSKVCFVGKHGVYWWRSGLEEPVNASDRYLPLWQKGQVNLDQLDKWAAGRHRNRALFSLTRAGSTVNDLALELHPEQGWLAPRSDAMSCYATSTGADETLFGGSPSVSGQVYQLETGGTDDGAAISWRLQTRWLELNGGFQVSVWQVRVHGRGVGTMTVRTDYAAAGGDNRSFDLTQELLTWDSGLLWDSGQMWGIPAFQQTEPFFDIGVCRQVSFLFAGSSTTVADGPQVLGQGSPPQVGAFGLSGLEYLYIPLGLS